MNLRFINIIITTQQNKIANAETFEFSETEPYKMAHEFYDHIDMIRGLTPNPKIWIQINGSGRFIRYSESMIAKFFR